MGTLDHPTPKEDFATLRMRDAPPANSLALSSRQHKAIKSDTVAGRKLAELSARTAQFGHYGGDRRGGLASTLGRLVRC